MNELAYSTRYLELATLSSWGTYDPIGEPRSLYTGSQIDFIEKYALIKPELDAISNREEKLAKFNSILLGSGMFNPYHIYGIASFLRIPTNGHPYDGGSNYVHVNGEGVSGWYFKMHNGFDDNVPENQMLNYHRQNVPVKNELNYPWNVRKETLPNFALIGFLHNSYDTKPWGITVNKEFINTIDVIIYEDYERAPSESELLSKGRRIKIKGCAPIWSSAGWGKMKAPPLIPTEISPGGNVRTLNQDELGTVCLASIANMSSSVNLSEWRSGIIFYNTETSSLETKVNVAPKNQKVKRVWFYIDMWSSDQGKPKDDYMDRPIAVSSNFNQTLNFSYKNHYDTGNNNYRIAVNAINNAKNF